MIDMRLQNLMDKTNQAWKDLCNILDDESMSGTDAANLMLTVNARFLNAVRKCCINEEGRKELKEEYMRLIEEKLG